MLDAKTARAIPATGALLCALGLAVGDWIARHPCLVLSGVATLLGLFFLLWAGIYRLFSSWED